ncbi:MAG: oligosaccharide flippase family protein, partial [Armatimonadetes bacterium]|nr:oligosaccharide flippase family protein [Armatimonadota bacterium]
MTSSSTGPGTPEQLARRIPALAFVRLAGMALSFAVNLALAQALGVVSFGAYTYIVSWCGVLGLVSAFGFDRLLARDVAVYSTGAQWGHLKGLLSWANGVTLLAALSPFAVVLLLMKLFATSVRFPMLPVWLAGCVLVPLIALGSVQQATLRGLFRPVAGQVPELALQPLFLLAFLG